MADLGSIAEEGLLTYGGHQADTWSFTGAEKGLLTYDRPLQSHIWYFTASEKGLLTYGRDLQGPVWLGNGAEKGLLTYGSTNPELEAVISMSTTLTAELTVTGGPTPPPQPLPTGVPNPQRPCPQKLKECLPCNDDPLVNTSSEDPDLPLFCATYVYRDTIPPLGQCAGIGGQDLASTAFACSEISQEDAILKAQLAAQLRVLQ